MRKQTSEAKSIQITHRWEAFFWKFVHTCFALVEEVQVTWLPQTLFFDPIANFNLCSVNNFIFFDPLFLGTTFVLLNNLRKDVRLTCAWTRTPKGQTKQLRVIFQMQHFLLIFAFSFFPQPRCPPRAASSLFLFLLDVRAPSAQFLCETRLFFYCAVPFEGFFEGSIQ